MRNISSNKLNTKWQNFRFPFVIFWLGDFLSNLIAIDWKIISNIQVKWWINWSWTKTGSWNTFVHSKNNVSNFNNFYGSKDFLADDSTLNSGCFLIQTCFDHPRPFRGGDLAVGATQYIYPLSKEHKKLFWYYTINIRVTWKRFPTRKKIPVDFYHHL